MQQNVTLSGRQAKFVESLLTSSTVTKAAEQCNISRVTAHRWLNDRNVAAQYREELNNLHRRNLDQLIKAEGKAIACLVRNLNASSEVVQVAAAGKLLDRASEAYRVSEIEEDLREIQERLGCGQSRKYT